MGAIPIIPARETVPSLGASSPLNASHHHSKVAAAARSTRAAGTLECARATGTARSTHWPHSTHTTRAAIDRLTGRKSR
ncbi:MAG: hypothetical protein ABIR05_05745 [Luteimonas sp.]